MNKADKTGILAVVNRVGEEAYNKDGSGYLGYGSHDTDVVEVTLQEIFDKVVKPQLEEGGIPEEDWQTEMEQGFADDWLGISCIAHVVRAGKIWHCSLAELFACQERPLYIAAHDDAGQSCLGLPDTGALKTVFVVK
jgi:hypothetical protein